MPASLSSLNASPPPGLLASDSRNFRLRVLVASPCSGHVALQLADRTGKNVVVTETRARVAQRNSH